MRKPCRRCHDKANHGRLPGKKNKLLLKQTNTSLRKWFPVLLMLSENQYESLFCSTNQTALWVEVLQLQKQVIKSQEPQQSVPQLCCFRDEQSSGTAAQPCLFCLEAGGFLTATIFYRPQSPKVCVTRCVTRNSFVSAFHRVGVACTGLLLIYGGKRFLSESEFVIALGQI